MFARRFDRLNAREQCFLLIAIAVAVRLALAPWFAGYDVSSWILVSDLMLGGQPVYPNTFRYPYPPLWSWLLFLLRTISLATGIPFVVAAKLPGILADIGITLLTFRLAIHRGLDPAMAFGTGLIVGALNPTLILVSAVQGQFDSVPTFLAFLAWYFFCSGTAGFARSSLLIPGIAIGVAIAFKLWPVLLIPLFIQQLEQPRDRFYFSTIAVLPALLILLPYLLRFPEAVTRHVFMYYGTVPWWGYYGFLFLFRKTFSLVGLGEPAHVIEWVMRAAIVYGRAAFLAVFGLMLYGYTWKMELHRAIAVCIFAFYVVIASFGPQYLVWGVPFVGLLDGFSRHAFRWRKGLWSLQAAYLLFFEIWVHMERNTGAISARVVFAPMLGLGMATWLCYLMRCIELLRDVGNPCRPATER